MAMAGQASGFDPMKVAGTAASGGIELAQVYDTLMRYNAETASFEPRVAKSLDHNATYDEWTLHLRPDVKFGNGDPLDADAVKASLERFRGPENKGAYRNLTLMITDMTVEDPMTLQLKLDTPYAGFPFALANTPGMIVNTKVAEARGASFNTDPSDAGVGAYDVSRFAPGEEIDMKAKKDYWNGLVCVDELRLIPIATDTGKYDAYRAGEIQAGYIRSAIVLDEAAKDGVDELLTYKNGSNVLVLNSGVRETTPPTKDVRVRQAIAYAVDVNKVDDRANEGTGFPTKAILGEKSPYYSGATGLKYDKDKAVGLLQQAKSDGYDGKLNLVCAKTAEETALAVEGQLNAAGFDVKLDLVPDYATLIDRVINKADYDAACYGLNALNDGLWSQLNNAVGSSSTAGYGLKDADMDAALDGLRTAESTEAITKAMSKVQTAWNEAEPVVILNANASGIIYGNKLHSLQLSSNELVFFAKAFLG